MANTPRTTTRQGGSQDKDTTKATPEEAQNTAPAAEETPKAEEAAPAPAEDAPKAAEETKAAPEETPDPEPNPLEVRRAALAAMKAAREIDSKVKCFACNRKAGLPQVRLQMGMVLCIDCGFEAMMDAAELADQLQEKSIRDAFGLTVPNIVEDKQEDPSAVATS